MQDRVSTYPGRVTLTPVEGQPNTYDMERADEPTQIGTALNTENLLSDTAAAAVSNKLGGTPDTPSDAFEIIAAGITKITAGTTELDAGTAALASGQVYLCYE